MPGNASKWQDERPRSLTRAIAALVAIGRLAVRAGIGLALSWIAIDAQNPKPTFRGLTEVVSVPRGYALVIGISDYPNLPKDKQLPFAASDMSAFYSALISPEAGQFPAENIHVLRNGEASLAKLRSELGQWLPSVAKPDDRVLIYFAGHGFQLGGKTYLAPADVDLKNLASTAYPIDELREVFASKIRAKWKVLFTDACRAGAIVSRSDMGQVNENLLRLGGMAWSFVASGAGELSAEGAAWGGHGVFSYYLRKALVESSADKDGDAVVTAQELYDYVRERVVADTKGYQHPEATSPPPDLILAYHPTRAPTPVLPAPKTGILFFESNMDGVEVFVDGDSKGKVDVKAPRSLPGIAPGIHTIMGTHPGYKPDGPREVSVYPGGRTTVTLRIVIQIERKKAAADEFNRGMADYQKGFEPNYRKATEHFLRALEIDPDYREAALYLGRTYNALFDNERAEAAFRQALKIDQAYAEAQASYGAMLLDLGKLDEAARQLTASLSRDPSSSFTTSLLGQLFVRKEALPEAIRYARESVRLAPDNPEAHFWLAEALRYSKACSEAVREYDEYLRLSNFDPKLADKIRVIVFGGRRSRPTQADIWRELRSMANFGLCDCKRLLKDYDSAMRHCQSALSLNSGHQRTHYVLAVTYTEKFNASQNGGYLPEAVKHFETTIQLNPNTVEAEKAKRYLAEIRPIQKRLKLAGN